MTRSCAVTGAFGYSGRYVARKLLARGDEVLTLTNSPFRGDLFAGKVRTAPLVFRDPRRLTKLLRGIDVLVNTYWVRFNHRGFSYRQAVENSKVLLESAAAAGVSRIVHVSITHPDLHSNLEYFRGKAELERHLEGLPVAHSMLRPAVLFGGEDILINNIAWALRKFPFFALFGDGSYRLRPIHVDDFADLIVEHTLETGNRVVDAVGPDRLSYRELVIELGRALGHERPILSAPAWLSYGVGKMIGWLMRDIFITWAEVVGLMEGRLDVPGTGIGTTSVIDWAKAHAEQLGQRYASELGRRRDRTAPY